MSTLAPVNAPDSVIAERALRHEFARHGRTPDIALHHEEAARPFNRVAIEVTRVDGREVGRSALRCYVFTVEIERPRASRHPVNRAERIATNARAGRRRHERTVGGERVDRYGRHHEERPGVAPKRTIRPDLECESCGRIVRGADRLDPERGARSTYHPDGCDHWYVERPTDGEREDIAERVHRGALLRTHVPADWPGVKAQCARHGLPTIREDGECYVR